MRAYLLVYVLISRLVDMRAYLLVNMLTRDL